jgi:hypothetical protein
MKTFDFMDVNDRIMVNTEFYYNYAGYDDNMFEELTYPFDFAGFATDYFESGNYGKYYGALFVTINEFITDDMTLSVSGMGNFSDLSFIAMTGFDIVPVNNFTISFTVTGYLGSDNREYTLAVDPTNYSIENNLLSLGIGAKVAF